MLTARRHFLRRAVQGALLLAALTQAGCAPVRSVESSPQLTVFVSGAFTPAFGKLAPEYEQRTGVRISVAHGPSMGATRNAIPNRLERGEAADVVILAREGLDRLAVAGKIVPGSESDLALSKIALAVKAGALAPDISTPEALRKALLSARSIAYSDSASGVYISTQLFPRLGIAGEMAGKAKMISATPVGLIVARGEAELGFQQLSELKPIAGIRIVGMLPDDLQKVTRFSAGIVSYSAKVEESRKLITFLQSVEVRSTVVNSGLQPVLDSR